MQTVMPSCEPASSTESSLALRSAARADRLSGAASSRRCLRAAISANSTATKNALAAMSPTVTASDDPRVTHRRILLVRVASVTEQRCGHVLVDRHATSATQRALRSAHRSSSEVGGVGRQGDRTTRHRPRAAFEPGDDQAGEGLVVALGQVESEHALHLVDVHVAAASSQSRRRSLRRRSRQLGIVFVGDLADEFLGHVLDGDDTGEAAVLVDDERHLLGRPPSAAPARRAAAGWSARPPRGACERAAPYRRRGAPSRSCRWIDTAQIVGAVTDHGVAGVPGPPSSPAPARPGRRHATASTRERGIMACSAVRVGKSRMRSSSVDSSARQFPGVARLRHDVLEVAGGRRVLDVVHRLDPQRAQQQVGRLVEQPDQPAEQRRYRVVEQRQPPGDRFGSRDGQVLREQLTEQHLHERREQHGQDGADGDPDRGRDADTTE